MFTLAPSNRFDNSSMLSCAISTMWLSWRNPAESNRFDHVAGRTAMKRSPIVRRLAVAMVALGLTASACSSQGAGSGSGSGTYSVWDPYPQFDKGSDWVKVIEKCGQQAGVTTTRQAYDTTDLTNKVLLAAQQGTAPNVLVVDNPGGSTLAEAGVLKSNQDRGVDAATAP